MSEHDNDPVSDFEDTPTARHRRLEAWAENRDNRLVRRALIWAISAALVPAVIGVGSMLLLARDTAATVDRLTAQVERHEEEIRGVREWRAGFERAWQERDRLADERAVEVQRRLGTIDARLERIEERLPDRDGRR